MDVADEQQMTAGTETPDIEAQVASLSEPGQPAAPESASDTTGQQVTDEAPTAPEVQVEKWHVNTDLTQLSAEQLDEGLKDPDNRRIHDGHLLRDRDYRDKTAEIARQTRALEELRGQTINLNQPQQPANPYAQTPTATTPPAQTPPQGNAEQMGKELVREFQEQYPEGDGEQYAEWSANRFQQMIKQEVEQRIQPMQNAQQQAEGQRMVAEVERQYAAVSQEFPHAAEPGVQEAVYEKLRQWDPSTLTDSTVREAYVAANADMFVSKPAAAPAPAPPRPQSLPPAAHKGEPATPIYEDAEEMIEAMLKDKKLASTLQFPGANQ